MDPNPDDAHYEPHELQPKLCIGAMLRADMGFYMGILFWAIITSFCRIRVVGQPVILTRGHMSYTTDIGDGQVELRIDRDLPAAVPAQPRWCSS